MMMMMSNLDPILWSKNLLVTAFRPHLFTEVPSRRALSRPFRPLWLDGDDSLARVYAKIYGSPLYSSPLVSEGVCTADAAYGTTNVNNCGSPSQSTAVEGYRCTSVQISDDKFLGVRKVWESPAAWRRGELRSGSLGGSVRGEGGLAPRQGG